MKLNELNNDDIINVRHKSNFDGIIMTVEEFKSNYNEESYYKNKERLEVYTTIKYKATLSAKNVLEDAIEREYDNMYEEWDERITSDIEEKDIEEIQIVLDRILARSSNISYYNDELVEIDI